MYNIKLIKQKSIVKYFNIPEIIQKYYLILIYDIKIFKTFFLQK